MTGRWIDIQAQDGKCHHRQGQQHDKQSFHENLALI